MRRRLIPAALLPLLLTAAPTASAGDPDELLLFPPPPQPARLAYVGQIADLQEFAPRRSLLDRVGGWLAGSKPGVELVRPHGLDADSDALLIADPEAGVVHRLDLDSGTRTRLPAEGRLVQPVDAAAGPGDVVFVSDPGAAQVVACDRSGRILFAGQGEFVRPAGLAWDARRERLLVADPGAHVVHVLDGRGNTIERLGARGTGPGRFNAPVDVAVTATGSILVLDALNHRVQTLDSGGSFVSEFGVQGDAPGYFARPRGLCVDSAGHILVTDAEQDGFQIFDAEGNLLLAIGGSGQRAGRFWMPAGIAAGPDDRIYVADAYNGRVQIFDEPPLTAHRKDSE